MAKFRIINLVRIDHDEEITLEKIPNMIASFFGATTEIIAFRGNGTVWHNLQTGRRADTMMEALIVDLVTGHKIRTRAQATK